MEVLDRRRARIDSRVEAVVEDIELDNLASSVRHAALSGGKRVRPTITLYSCETVGGDATDAIDFAVAIELVHAASLVVDDIVDRSDRRRGTASVWAEFGHGSAIIASDALLGEAFSLLESDSRATELVAESMIALGMGEATELVEMPTDRSAYQRLAERKTGALFRAAAELGGLAAEADQETITALGDYAEHVGVAFQIRDDVLDATASGDELGKPAGQDAEIGRPSIVRVDGVSIEEANNRAARVAKQALECLDTVDIRDEEAATYLRNLAGFVVERDH